MTFKEKVSRLYQMADEKFLQQFGFRMKEVTFTKVVFYLHEPRDASSLAVTRILFGLCMLLDIPDERGGSTMDSRWGQSHICHFPLFPFITALPMPLMAMVYAFLCFGAIGITLGYNYRKSCVLFTTCYWYLLLIEKSYWNNHSYLFGLVGILMTFTQAHCFWSIDAYLHPSIRSTTVPYWNYFILKYQFFILYFVAGLKKGSAEWLTGYSVQKLAEHWVFDPFKWFLTVQQIDYLIVHWFIFAFDLTVAFWMMWAPTRPVATIICAMFHLMNSRLFSIGMFPWVCLATLPLFYPFDWPQRVIQYFTYENTHCNCNDQNFSHFNQDLIDEDDFIDENQNLPSMENKENADTSLIENDGIVGKDQGQEELDAQSKNQTEAVDAQATMDLINNVTEYIDTLSDTNNNHQQTGASLRKKLTTVLIFLFVIVQAFLPYSHFITKGYNNWTNGLYGYSWDMMVHSWESISVVVKVVDNDHNRELYIDPMYYTGNDRWTRHGDMVYQYGRCLKQVLMKYQDDPASNLSQNISIYIDIWYSLNGRFTQRMFDPKKDILSVMWSPFESISFLMPLLDEALSWRNVMDELRMEVQTWNNKTDVVFFADFPGYDQEKYIPNGLKNVTLTILEGKVGFGFQTEIGQSNAIFSGTRIEIPSGTYHTVKNIGTQPIYYMYTFTNTTEMDMDSVSKPKLPIVKELYEKFEKMCKFAKLVFSIVFYCFWMSRCA